MGSVRSRGCVVLYCTHSGAPHDMQTDRPFPGYPFCDFMLHLEKTNVWRHRGIYTASSLHDFRVAYTQLNTEVYNNLYCCRLTQITILTSWVLKPLQPPQTVFALNVLKQWLLKMLVFVFHYPWGILLPCQYAAKAM